MVNFLVFIEKIDKKNKLFCYNFLPISNLCRLLMYSGIARTKEQLKLRNKAQINNGWQ